MDDARKKQLLGGHAVQVRDAGPGAGSQRIPAAAPRGRAGRVPADQEAGGRRVRGWGSPLATAGVGNEVGGESEDGRGA